MTAEEIVAVAMELDCGPSDSAVSFARMIAEHCAQLAEEVGDATTGAGIAAIIRGAFLLSDR